MRCLLIASDVAPRNILQLVGTTLKSSGHEFTFPSTLDAPIGVTSYDVALIGMSSLPREIEPEVRAASLFRAAGKPFGFIADTYQVYRRPACQEFRDHATLFVVDEVEAEEARQAGWKHVVASGNPSWEQFFFPKLTREFVRHTLNMNPEDHVILCPGGKGKGGAIYSMLLGAIVEAQSLLPTTPFTILFTPHPKDGAPREAYAELVEYGGVKIVEPEQFSGGELVVAADLVVQSVSTVGIEAAHQYKPVVDYITALAWERLKRVVNITNWPPCERGISLQVNGTPTELANAIQQLLSMEGSTAMRRHQEELYPRPKAPGETARRIIDTLESLTR